MGLPVGNYGGQGRTTGTVSGMTRRRKRGSLACLLSLVGLWGGGEGFAADEGPGGHVSFIQTKDAIEVKIDGALFTRYVWEGFPSPIFYPVMGPKGEAITRHYPMKEGVAGEETDHRHHRSLWFGHRHVHGEDFWGSSGPRGTMVHEGVRQLSSGGEGKPGVMVVTNEWRLRDGTVIGHDERRYRFWGLGGGEVLLEYGIIIRADAGEAIHFGDDKDGGVAIRTAPWLRLEGPVARGRAVNSEGVEGRLIWGKRAQWVDFWGPDEGGDVLGVAMFDHPANLRHPTGWHARHYGLIAANPFAEGSFARKSKGDKVDPTGAYTVDAGEALTLRYGILFHRGDPTGGRVAERYAEWVKDES
jgi:hypothetical protein